MPRVAQKTPMQQLSWYERMLKIQQTKIRELEEALELAGKDRLELQREVARLSAKER